MLANCHRWYTDGTFKLVARPYSCSRSTDSLRVQMETWNRNLSDVPNKKHQKGCNFHWNQAVVKLLNKLGLRYVAHLPHRNRVRNCVRNTFYMRLWFHNERITLVTRKSHGKKINHVIITSIKWDHVTFFHNSVEARSSKLIVWVTRVGWLAFIFLLRASTDHLDRWKSEFSDIPAVSSIWCLWNKSSIHVFLLASPYNSICAMLVRSLPIKVYK